MSNSGIVSNESIHLVAMPAEVRDSVVRMLAWKEAHSSTEFDLDPKWFVARVPGHEPIGAMSLDRLMDKLEMLEAADELDTDDA